jgi:hypothetical protein
LCIQLAKNQFLLISVARACHLLTQYKKDEQPILPTSTNPCITTAAGTQKVKLTAQ